MFAADVIIYASADNVALMKQKIDTQLQDGIQITALNQ